jgi:diaminohydroxyphosphoribosylaminopyrimidine deaminase/5-amino-6-(5-phosphoribosylamino)uracil reductase
LPSTLHIYNKEQATIIFNKKQHTLDFNIKVGELKNDEIGYYQATEDISIVQQVMNACYQMNIQSILVEGGAKLLQSFIDEGLWDEIRRIENRDDSILTNNINGLKAPALPGAIKVDEQKLFSDMIEIFKRPIANE